MKIVIIDYGAGNIKSIQFAIERLGFQAVLSSNANEITSADKVIFPGVGEAASAMRKLKASNLDTLITQLKQPVLGICLGMQLLCNYSAEGETKGLGIFDVDVIKFSSEVKVPQMGWNTLKPLRSQLFEEIKEGEFMYFVHSFYAPLCEDTIASTNYQLRYSSALQKNNFYGVQFHPEKSSAAGSILLQNFLKL